MKSETGLPGKKTKKQDVYASNSLLPPCQDSEQTNLHDILVTPASHTPLFHQFHLLFILQQFSLQSVNTCLMFLVRTFKVMFEVYRDVRCVLSGR